MSTSPSPCRSPGTAPSAPAADLREAAPFPYREITAGMRRFGGLLDEAGTSDIATDSQKGQAEQIDEARKQGRQEGLAEARKSFEEELARERAAISNALLQFAKDRATYYQKVEAEVVQLALSIARKILHRESQLDPLLLAGVVRVALEKIEGATEIALLLHPQNAAEWRRYLALHLEPGSVPEIIEDPAMEVNSCLLRTSMGTAKLGLEIQLKEIEQGLMDLLAARPGESS